MFIGISMKWLVRSHFIEIPLLAFGPISRPSPLCEAVRVDGLESQAAYLIKFGIF